MKSKRWLWGFVIAAGVMFPGAAFACEDGAVLTPGTSCELDVKWGHDHWVIGEFPENGQNKILFTHVAGDCNVSLFGPIEALLSPQAGTVESALPGEYHLFTRAITVAQQACVYQISVD